MFEVVRVRPPSHVAADGYRLLFRFEGVGVPPLPTPLRRARGLTARVPHASVAP